MKAWAIRLYSACKQKAEGWAVCPKRHKSSQQNRFEGKTKGNSKHDLPFSLNVYADTFSKKTRVLTFRPPTRPQCEVWKMLQHISDHAKTQQKIRLLEHALALFFSTVGLTQTNETSSGQSALTFFSRRSGLLTYGTMGKPTSHLIKQLNSLKKNWIKKHANKIKQTLSH